MLKNVFVIHLSLCITHIFGGPVFLVFHQSCKVIHFGISSNKIIRVCAQAHIHTHTRHTQTTLKYGKMLTCITWKMNNLAIPKLI